MRGRGDSGGDAAGLAPVPSPDRLGLSVILTDRSGIVTSWNRGAEQLFGWSAADALGHPVLPLTAPLLDGEEASTIRSEVLQGRNWAGELLLRHRDGSVFSAVVLSCPYRGADGEVLGTVTITAALSPSNRSSQWYRTVVEQLEDLIVVLDDEARIVYVSPTVEAVLGRLPDDVVGRPCWEYIDERDHEVVATALAEVFDDAVSPSPALFRVLRVDGSSRWIEALGNRLPSGDGRDGIVVVGRDVHDRELAAAEARQARLRAETSELHLRAVLQASPIALVALDADGVCTAAGGQLFQDGGLPEPTVGRSLRGLVRCLDETLDRDEGLVASGHRTTHEVEHEDRVILVHHAPLHDEGGRFQGSVLVATDITAERRAQAELGQREARFRALVQRSADAALIADAEGVIMWASPAVTALFGFEPEALVGRLGWDFIHPDDLPQVARRYRDLVVEGRPQPSFEMRIRQADGTWCWVEEQLTNLLDEPAVCGVVANLRDVTARRTAMESLADSEQRYRTIVESAGEGICIYDADGRVTLANPRLRAMIGARRLDHVIDMVHPDDLPIAAEGLRRRRQGLSDSYELRLLDAEGQVVHVLITANPLYAPDGSHAGGLLMLADITERKRAEEELSRLALTDTVTGLPNRALILDRLEQALARTERHGRRVAVMFLDVDQFKLVNDSFGHLVGDELLRVVAQRLSDGVRAVDTTVGRLGGDEFVVLVDALEHDDDAVGIAARIHEAIAAPFRLGSHELYVTVSIGIAFGPPGDADTLLSHADAAMYRAKQAGRARTELFDDDMREAARQRLQLLTELRSAVELDQLTLEYQPVLDLESGAVLGAEALVRWTHPKRGTIAPGAFIGAAEDSGLIVEVGARVLRLALSQGARWEASGLPLELSVNLSARQLSEPTLTATVARALTETGFDPGRLCLEITESAVMEDVDAAVEVMSDLRRLGVRLAIDDFGTGYSSLTYLSRLPVDVLKIDRAFIAPLPKEGEPIVEAITRLARAVGVSAIAEGVEHAAQADTLRRLGCHGGQGFLWSEAVPADEFEAVVRRLQARRRSPEPQRRRGDAGEQEQHGALPRLLRRPE